MENKGFHINLNFNRITVEVGRGDQLDLRTFLLKYLYCKNQGMIANARDLFRNFTALQVMLRPEAILGIRIRPFLTQSISMIDSIAPFRVGT